MIRDQKMWPWHVLAGVVILVLLGLHMTIMHLEKIIRIFNPAPGHPVEWLNVASRSGNMFFAVTYVILLGAALFHGLYGLRNILFELHPPAWLKTAIGLVLGLVGLGLFAYGTWAAIASFHALAGTL